MVVYLTQNTVLAIDPEYKMVQKWNPKALYPFMVIFLYTVDSCYLELHGT